MFWIKRQNIKTTHVPIIYEWLNENSTQTCNTKTINGNNWEVIIELSVLQHWEAIGNISGPVFCLLLRVSSNYAQPITGQVTEVNCPVIGRTQPEPTRSKRQKTGPGWWVHWVYDVLQHWGSRFRTPCMQPRMCLRWSTRRTRNRRNWTRMTGWVIERGMCLSNMIVSIIKKRWSLDCLTFMLKICIRIFKLKRGRETVDGTKGVSVWWWPWTCFLSFARSTKLRLCSANHRPGYWSNLPCDWPYSQQETENRPKRTRNRRRWMRKTDWVIGSSQ